MRIQDEALVLRRTPFRETSLVIHFLTRNHGLVSTVAKGIRRSGRRGRSDRGALSGFHTVSLACRSRSFTAMGTLTRAEILTARQTIPASATALAAAQVILEVAYRFSVAGDARPEVMMLIESSLDLLDKGAPPLEVVSSVLSVLVHAVGYGWRTDVCAGCQGEDLLLFFSLRRGQVVCQPCGQPYTSRLVPLSKNMFNCMRKLAWPPDFGLLSTAEQALVYRVAIASLIRAGGKALMTDPPFRNLVGHGLFSQTGYTPTDIRFSQ
ncbi:MAG: DNA repair protein RecO [Magnetococcales bacterium]|nr:DNA repair protein RecO [Magnetococcales bacterium]